MSIRGLRFATGELPALGDIYAYVDDPKRTGTVVAEDLTGRVDWAQYRLVERDYLDTTLTGDYHCELCGRRLTRGSRARGRVEAPKNGPARFFAACILGACYARPAPAEVDDRPVLGQDRNGRAVRKGMTIRATDREGMTCVVEEVRGGTHFHGPHVERGEGYFADIPFGNAEVVTVLLRLREGQRVRILVGERKGLKATVLQQLTLTRQECVDVRVDGEETPRLYSRTHVRWLGDEGPSGDDGFEVPHIPTEQEASGDAAMALEACARFLAESTKQQIRERKYEWFRAAVSVAVAEEPTMTAITDMNEHAMRVWVTAPLVGTRVDSIGWSHQGDYLEDARMLVMSIRGAVMRDAANAILGKRTRP